MSRTHPIIAVTGSSGAGTTTTSQAFRKIFQQLDAVPAIIEGDSFHRYTRPEMDAAIRKAREQGRHISYFGPEANDFALLESTFRQYSENGSGERRKYLHTYDEAVPYNQLPAPLPPARHCLPVQTCFSTRVFTAAWSHRNIILPDMWICWSA